MSSRSSRFSIVEEALQILAELGGQGRMSQRVVDGRLQIAELLPGVIALPFENVTVEIALPDQSAHRIRQLNLAPCAALRLLQNRKNLGRKNVTADDCVL